MKHSRLLHRFVRSIPKELEPGVLYVSVEYATAIHACCCGCGNQVVTPFTPTDWQMTFDGEAISLSPSIGNWNLPCRSHYLIKRGRVVVAESWNSRLVMAGRSQDRANKAKHYQLKADDFSNDRADEEGGVLGKLRSWLFGNK